MGLFFENVDESCSYCLERVVACAMISAMQILSQSALAGITQSASVRLQSLTAQGFAPYGQVLQLDAAGQRAINQGTSSRLNLLAALDLHGANGQAVLAVFHAQAQSPRTPCQMLERHNWGSQSFVPLLGARCRLWVATGDATPDLNTLACFEVSGQQGFTLNKGVWHHPLMALEASSFLVIEREGPQEDCEVFTLHQAIHPIWDEN
jgi:ureidoglycolate lyase